MVAYTSIVSKLEAASDIPEDVRNDTTHHVKDSHGKTFKFRNPTPPPAALPNPHSPSPASSSGSAKLTGDMPDPDITNVKIPTVKPSFSPTRTGSSDALRATWLGHACYLTEFPSGLRVLFDPVFDDRCGPMGWLGPKRYTSPACALADLPEVDAVVISHSHYDHLSHGSVMEIAKRNPNAWFFVGMGLERWFRSSGIERHSSGRTGRDHDHTLWCSWAVKSGGKSVWFGGDTGYRRVPKVAVDIDDYGPEYDSLPRCPQFKQIGELRGPFDLGLIPIGAYRPRWMWSWMHANPYDSVEIFKDTRCKRAMGIHWGTWMLTSEEVEEPPRLLREALKTSGIPEEGVFDVCAVGETREF
ncbi:hypothetical protein N0V88_002792 [Collariella sp. IMI 366227]|nr:hypothetical protein N0V88_002792 [Collariella sp. IMI 366227]